MKGTEQTVSESATTIQHLRARETATFRRRLSDKNPQEASEFDLYHLISEIILSCII